MRTVAAGKGEFVEEARYALIGHRNAQSADDTGKHFKTHHSKISIERKDPKNPESLHSGRTKSIMIADGVLRIPLQYVTRLDFVVRLESV